MRPENVGSKGRFTHATLVVIAVQTAKKGRILPFQSTPSVVHWPVREDVKAETSSRFTSRTM